MENWGFRFHALLFASSLLPLASFAETRVATSAVTFSASTLVDSDAKVRGELRLPDSSEKLPAVVIIHNAGGLQDRTGSDYIDALNSAGIATLELDLFGIGKTAKNDETH